MKSSFFRTDSNCPSLGETRIVAWAVLAAGLFLACAISALAQPVVTNATRSVYARVTDPEKITFAPDGTLFVGRDNGGSGGGSVDAVKIHRIAPGGSPVTEFGNVAIADPDAVAYDASGKISGTAGAVIVGGATGSGRGKLSIILPDGTVTTLFGPSSSMPNPSDFVFDAAGRLLFVEIDAGNVWVMTNATPVVLISGLTEPSSIAVDALGRVVLGFSGEERLRLYSASGALLSNNFVTAKSGSPLARGPGGMWGTGIYYLDPNGKLMTVDANGNKTSVGSRFDETAVDDLEFGPDGALYVSDFDNDRIFRFAQPAVPNATTTVYARVTDPQTLSFAPDGTLFLGRDATGSGGIGADAVKITRVAPGGSPASEYGTTAIADPDAVVYDVSGQISGTAGAVIVGGVTADGSGEGQLSKISPEGAVTRLFGPSSSMINPADFVFDAAGRLLIADGEGGRVWVMTNATPRTLISELDQPSRIAVDSLGRILVSSPNEASVRLYSATGTSITNTFVRTMDTTPMALGPGGFWGTGVFCVNTNGDLLTVDLNGHAAKFGTGFGRLTDIGFGPDGALYASQAESDLIWRIAPSVVVPPTTATTYTFTTLAGLAGTSGVTDGIGSAARFYQPAYVVLESAGNAYVTDHGNHTIREITPDGVVSTLAGLPRNRGSADGTGSAARFYLPTGLALDSAGNLFVADYGNHTIRQVTPGGVVTTLAGLAGSSGNTDGAGSAARFDKPDGVAVDGAGNVYVADGANHTIRKVTSSGVVTTLAGLAGSSGSADGPGSAARFFLPAGVALDSAGNLYVADYSNHTIRKVTPGGVVTTVAGLAERSGSADGTGSAARFDEPNGVAVDGAGNLYVADYSNHTIRKVTPDGIVTTLGGLAGSSGKADGPGSIARFQNPCAIAVDRAGKLYVTDLLNSTIRIGTPTQPAVPNAVTTVYARVTDPDSLSFAPDGTLFVGRDNSGSGGGNSDAVKIHRIAPGGSPVTEYGNDAIMDPDGVVFDATGRISGTAGAVIVGGDAGSSRGRLSIVSPDGTISTLFGPSSSMRNPNDFVFDAAGRLLFVDGGSGGAGSAKIWVMTNATPQTLATGLNSGVRIAVDSLGRIVIDSEKEASLRLYSASGTAITFPLVQTEAYSPLATGPGGFWGTGIFCVNTNGDLLTVDVNGNATQFGTGFGTEGSVADFAFGPDGALYASDFANDLIWRVAPAVVVPNQPPAVTLANPSANALFYAPANPTLRAAASDADGTVVKVEFYQGATKLGVAFYPPFTFTPTNLPAGTYSFTAKATDGGGLATTSAVLTVNVSPSDASSVITGQWDFEQGDLRATVGNDLEYCAPAVQTGTQFDTTRSFGIADISGQVANVMKVPYLKPMDGYIMRHGTGPNGGGEWVNQYTLIFDLFYPASAASQWKVLLQETPDNSNDGDFFIDSAGGIGYGSSTSYQGKVTFGAWHRITLAVDLTVPVVAKFIDGAKVGEQKLTEGLDKRWALLHAGYDPNFALLFADDDGENCEFYVNSVQFRSGRMSDAAVAALGGPSATGIPFAAAPANNAPTVSLTKPANNAAFTAPATIVLEASASDTDGTIAKVEFFSGSTKLGEDTTAPYNFTWNNVAEGTYSLSAKATDNQGAVTASSAIANTVGTAPPPTGSSYTFTTLAGLAGATGSSDGTGSAARFNTPLAVAVDSQGNVYVADMANNTVRKITPGGVVTTLAGSAASGGSTDGTGGAARFNNLQGVAVDSNGNVYVADQSNHTIRKITPAGVVSTLAGLAGSIGSTDGTGGAARFNYPRSVAVDGAGNVYVADESNHTIRKITPAGVVSTLAGSAGSVGSADGTGSAARFHNPCGVAADSAGNVYVADTRNYTIRKITPAGGVTTLAGLAGESGTTEGAGSAARFYYPAGVAVDGSGNVYVAGSHNQTIQLITPAGMVSTLGGLAGSVGSADGTGSAARFNYPQSVAVDSGGRIYVADTSNHTIRLGTPSVSNLSADTLVSQGRATLATGNLSAAHDQFTSVLATHPTHPAANTLAAASGLGLVPTQPVVRDFLDRVGISQQGRDPLNWTAQMPTNSAGHRLFPAGVTVGDLASFASTNLVPALEAADVFLGNVTDTNFTLRLAPTESRLLNSLKTMVTFFVPSDARLTRLFLPFATNLTTSGDVMLDYADLVHLRAINAELRLIARAAAGTDLKWDLSTAPQYYDTNGLLNLEKVLADHPSFLRPGNTNDMAARRAAFVQLAELQPRAMALVNSRTDKETHLFNYGQPDEWASLLQLLLPLLKASLDQPMALPLGTNVVVNLAPMFSGTFDVRSLLPKFQGSQAVLGSFPDLTMGGLVKGLPMEWFDDLLVAVTGTPAISQPGNQPPTVRLLEPGNGSGFPATWTITMTATATDPDGSIAKVEFFAETTKLGEYTTAPYSFVWTNVPAGNFAMTARATDNQGATTTSATNLIEVTGTLEVVGIAENPQSQAVDAGATVTFQVVGTGTPPLRYQWLKGLNYELPGETNSTLVLRNVTAADAGEYSVFVMNAVSSTRSLAATLTVRGQPPIVRLTSPANNAAFAAGATITISAEATDPDGSVTAVEFYSGTTRLGPDTTAPYSFTWSNVAAGSYTLVAKATDNQGASTTSAAVVVTFGQAAPTITTQPHGQTAAVGATASFTVVASGNPAPTYQWRKDGKDLSGATSTTLTLSNVQAADAGNYTVVVSNVLGSVTSAGAVLTVQTPSGGQLTFTQWAALNKLPAGADGPTGSPSGDGVPNLLKFALGLDPKVPAPRSLITCELATVSGQKHTAILFTHAKNATGIQILLEASDDLRSWAQVPATLEKIVDIDASTERVRLVENAPLGNQRARFYRLSVATVSTPVTGKLNLDATVSLVQTNIGPAGGTITLNKPGDPLHGLQITIPTNALKSVTPFEISSTAIQSHSFGEKINPITPLIRVENGGDFADDIITVKVPINLPADHFALAFMYHPATGRLEGMPLLELTSTSITLATCHFSEFFISAILTAKLPDEANSNFKPGVDDWEYANWGSYLAPGGHCAGQSASAMWYYCEKKTKEAARPLYNRFDNQGFSFRTPTIGDDDVGGYKFASRVQKDIIWTNPAFEFWNDLHPGDQNTYRAFLYSMDVTREPQFVGIRYQEGGGHALVAYHAAYGWLYVADPNFPGKRDRNMFLSSQTGKFDTYYSGPDATHLGYSTTNVGVVA